MDIKDNLKYIYKVQIGNFLPTVIKFTVEEEEENYYKLKETNMLVFKNDINKYKDILTSIYNSKDIDSLEDSIEKIDEEIRNEFIGCYFIDKDNNN